MEKLAQQLGPRATLKLLSDADHSFHVPARTGRKDADIRVEILDALAAWIETLVQGVSEALFTEQACDRPNY